MINLTNEDKRELLKRLVKIRSKAIREFPFWGMLMLKLKFSIAACETAATDMHRIMFDSSFVTRLSDDELEFVMLHETMHCALQHIVRGKGKHKKLYNIATDIVINSCLLRDMRDNKGLSGKFWVDGEEPMHLAPNGKEGYVYNADQIYNMLLMRFKAEDDESLDIVLNGLYGSTIDDHGIWDTVEGNLYASEEWKDAVSKAASGICCGGEIPSSVREFLKDIDYEGKLNWKEVLHEFIKTICEKYDYMFTPPDRRYSDSEFIMPAFDPIEEDTVDNIWFVVDTSGSISNETLAMLYKEICYALVQFEHLAGKLSFFDTTITEPTDFAEVDDIKEIKPVGGGGTSFHCIFVYMEENMREKLPEAVIIMTDGYASYPTEYASLGVPVLWIIIGNDKDAPWGTTIHI